MDTINAIEECLAKGLPLSIEQDVVRINEATFPCSLETVFYYNDKPITLDSLVAAIIFSKKYAEYRAECTRSKIGFLDVMTRSSVLRYFYEGDKNTNLIRLPGGAPAVPSPTSSVLTSTQTSTLFGTSRKRLSEWTLQDVLDDEVSTSSKASSMTSSLPREHKPLSESLKSILHEAEKVDLVRVSVSGLLGPAKSLSSSKAAALLPAASPYSAAAVAAASTGSRSAANPDKKQKTSAPVVAKEEPRGTPIIIVPSPNTAMIGLHNAEQFLFQGKYVPLSEFDTAMPPPSASSSAPHNVNCKRPSVLKPHSQALFMITDAPEKLTQGEWDRVVAVFVSGQQWQLKPFRIGKTPTEIFGKVPGFYLHFENDYIHDNAKTWPVTRYEISRTKRHLDSPHVAAFWTRVLEHISQSPAGKKIAY